MLRNESGSFRPYPRARSTPTWKAHEHASTPAAVDHTSDTGARASAASAAAAMLLLQSFKGRRDLNGLIAKRSIAPDQVGVHVRKADLPPGQVAPREEIEEHRAAADEWLEIALEAFGVELG